MVHDAYLLVSAAAGVDGGAHRHRGGRFRESSENGKGKLKGSYLAAVPRQLSAKAVRIAEQEARSTQNSNSTQPTQRLVVIDGIKSNVPNNKHGNLST